ncbi:MAG: Magnesium and cobalt efflux protein CorC [Candidatus Omnitrophica bacterium ADurb.Bin277]|nr:MAG: Magnesium and cobalt efflux protein CorC [Candidatus Omnitrophica bacterium ADurb.Bin277]
MNASFEFVLVAILFVFSGFFSSSETALFSLSKLDKRKLKEQYPRFSKWVLDLLEQPRKTLGTILIGNLIVNTLATTVATFFVVANWGEKHLGFAMAVFTVLLIVFCETMPKILAVRNKVKLSILVALPLRIFVFLFTPLRLLMRYATEKILSVIVREKIEQSDMISENELKVLVKIGEEEGVLGGQERHMIQKLLDLGERPVKDIMVPRTDMVALDVEDGPEKHDELIRKAHHEHMPVYEGSLDNVVGVVMSLDYLLHEPRPAVKGIMKKPLFIPESKKIDDLLETFKANKEWFAVCVDEYGGTAGIVTQEDVLEEIFGEFYDEYEKVENPIRRLGVDLYIVEGKVPLQDFNDYFLAKLEAEEASTLGGYLLEKMGVVPVKEAKYETEDFEFVIQSMIRQRIQHVLVRKKI